MTGRRPHWTDAERQLLRYAGITNVGRPPVEGVAQWDEAAPAVVPVHVVPAKGLAAGVDSRYQVAPGEPVWGCGFRAAGPGRDVTTGEAWR